MRVLKDHQGQLWFATYGGGINRYLPELDGLEQYNPIPNDPTSLNHKRIWSLLETADHTLFAGTQGGLAMFLPASKAWLQYRTGSSPDNLNDNCVIELTQSRDGAIWVGTYAGGLNRFDMQTGKFKAFGSENGLPSNLVCAVLEDEQGNLWISSPNGLCRLDPRTGATRIYDEGDGLPSRQFNRGAQLKRSNGQLLFGSVDGLVSFFPEKIEADNSFLNVVLTRFEVFNKDQSPGAADSPLKESITRTRRLEISSGLSTISFQFAALGYRAPASIHYEYLLEGFDKTWQTAGRERRATYTNLEPGEYRLKIRAANREGKWSTNGNGMELIIHPAWWQTWWVRGLVFVSILCAAGMTGWKVSGNRSRRRILAAEQARSLADERQQAALEREKLLIQLQQSQKMESVGRLAGGIAHDFNNMLSVILGNSSLALDEPNCSAQVREHLDEIKNAAQRSADLTRQLLAFARKQKIKPRILNLNETVAGMLKMLRRLIGEEIELLWRPGNNLWFVQIDPSQLDQVLVNLTVNARDAIAGVGSIIRFSRFFSGKD